MSCKTIVFHISLLFFSCFSTENNEPQKLVSEKIQSILDAQHLNGVVLLFDKQNNTFYSNNFTEASKPELPASTFKIPNTIISLETGLLKDRNAIFKWNGEIREFPVWERDLTVQEAFQLSCVPCYQKLAKEIGVKRMKEYLEMLKFGKMNVNVENIQNFWLEGSSKITAFEQVNFLKRLYFGELSISDKTVQEMKTILVIKRNLDYVLSGKTGLIFSKDEKYKGWFVGYIEKGQQNIFFATKVYPKSQISKNKFLLLRKEVTLSALEAVGFIKKETK